jgi:hypothetical protein
MSNTSPACENISQKLYKPKHLRSQMNAQCYTSSSPLKVTQLRSTVYFPEALKNEYVSNLFLQQIGILEQIPVDRGNCNRVVLKNNRYHFPFWKHTVTDLRSSPHLGEQLASGHYSNRFII